MKVLIVLISLIAFHYSFAQDATPTMTPTPIAKPKVNLDNIQENYGENYLEKSRELRQYFNTKVKEIEDSYILLEFLKNNRAKKSIEIKVLTDFFLSLSSEKRLKLLEEIKELKGLNSAPSVPYVLVQDKGEKFDYKNDIPANIEAEKILNLYTTSEPQILNTLLILDYALKRNIAPYILLNSRNKMLFNFRTDISTLSFSNLSWHILVAKWEKDLFGILFDKIKEEIDLLQAEMKESYKQAEESLFIPKEVLENKAQILFALNTCEYSHHSVNVEGTTMMYEDYAFLHMRELIKFLNKDSQIALGYVDGDNYGFTALKTKEQLANLFENKKSFSEFLYLSIRPNLIKSGRGNNENISTLYKQTQNSGLNFKYALFFTDGYGSPGNDKSIVHATATKFLFKGMCPECGTYGRYVSQVPKAGKDIVLNNLYLKPKYEEFFDKRNAMLELDLLMEELEVRLKPQE
jgi:hypothetical protein